MLIQPVEFGLPAHFTSWRRDQFDVVNWIVDTPGRFLMVCAPVGAGKSLMYMAAALCSGKRTVVLTSTKGLQDQLNRDFNSISVDIRGMQNYRCEMAGEFGFPPYTKVADAPCQAGARCPKQSNGCEYFDSYRAAQQADIVVTNYQCWMYDQIKRSTLKTERPVQMLILDECFAAGTLVDGKPIEQIKLGDRVTSFSGKWFGKNAVVRLYKRPAPSRMCRIYFNNGAAINCTLNHPFYTRQGWVPAYRLLLGNVQCMWLGRNHERTKGLQVRFAQDKVPTVHPDFLSLVQGRSYRPWFQDVLYLPAERRARVLLDELRTSLPRPFSIAKDNARLGAPDAFQAHDRAQPDAQPQSQSKDESNAPRYGMEADSARRERSGAIHISEVASFDLGMADGSADILGFEEAFFADVLQGRYSGLCFASCDRSGRDVPQLVSEEEARPQEGARAYWVRVDGFEIYEQTDRKGFASVCPDGYVYNLEVEGAHTYTAQGFVVHNCHDAIEQLSSYLATELERKECLSLGVSWPLPGYSQGEWKDWGVYWKGEMEDRRGELEDQVRESVGPGMSVLHEIREIKRLERKLSRVAEMQDDWVIEETKVGARFDPLWPKHYREHLFRGVEKVVMVSATVRPKTAELLGVPESELAFSEYKSTFPIANRPIIHVPTVRMNYRNEADDGVLSWWLRKADLLMNARPTKGLFHSVSYKRARLLLDNSQNAHRMMIHGSDTRADVIERFRRADPTSGATLVSPSVDTGYDFPYESARWQIIGKIPFPDTRGAVMKARCSQDRDYGMYLTVQTIQQMTGRIVRADDDWGETIIIDDNIVWLVSKYRHFFNHWWLEAFYTCKGRLPVPLAR
jgi:hypothetical protein